MEGAKVRIAPPVVARYTGPKAVCTCATKQHVRNWTRQEVVYNTAHQLT